MERLKKDQFSRNFHKLNNFRIHLPITLLKCYSQNVSDKFSEKHLELQVSKFQLIYVVLCIVFL